MNTFEAGQKVRVINSRYRSLARTDEQFEAVLGKVGLVKGHYGGYVEVAIYSEVLKKPYKYLFFPEELEAV